MGKAKKINYKEIYKNYLKDKNLDSDVDSLDEKEIEDFVNQNISAEEIEKYKKPINKK